VFFVERIEHVELSMSRVIINIGMTPGTIYEFPTHVPPRQKEQGKEKKADGRFRNNLRVTVKAIVRRDGTCHNRS